MERAQALRHYESTRIYRLSYRGFPGDRDAEMTVEATYDSPSTKSFKVISQTGSKLIIDRVFKRLLDSEKEAAEPEMHAAHATEPRQLRLRADWLRVLGRRVPSGQEGSQYVLAVYPKAKSKYLYRGKVWVDATDFAVTRIDAEPAQNPSFWTKKNEMHHEYMKVQDFWLPRRNESVSYIRLGGRATLTIEYSNYRLSIRGHRGTQPKHPLPGWMPARLRRDSRPRLSQPSAARPRLQRHHRKQSPVVQSRHGQPDPAESQIPRRSRKHPACVRFSSGSSS